MERTTAAIEGYFEHNFTTTIGITSDLGFRVGPGQKLPFPIKGPYGGQLRAAPRIGGKLQVIGRPVAGGLTVYGGLGVVLGRTVQASADFGIPFLSDDRFNGSNPVTKFSACGGRGTGGCLTVLLDSDGHYRTVLSVGLVSGVSVGVVTGATLEYDP